MEAKIKKIILMKKQITILGFAMLLSVANVMAQTDAAKYETLDINNINAKILPSNIQFCPDLLDGNAGYVYPADRDSLTTIFSYALWIGGEAPNGDLKLAAEKFHQHPNGGGESAADFQPGPINVVNGSYSSDEATIQQWSRVWKLSALEIQEFLTRIKNGESINDDNVPEAIRTWPAHGNVSKGQLANIAPFFDNDKDGVYNWRRGDYPMIKGDQCIFFVYNDARPHTESQSEPLNIEIHAMAYAFGDPTDAAFWNSMFFNYTIHNRSENNYNNVNIGAWTDLEIGYGYDDYVGCDVERGMFFGYNGGTHDPYYGDQIPAQGVAILGGAYLDPNGYDNPAFKDTPGGGPSFEGDCMIVSMHDQTVQMSFKYKDPNTGEERDSTATFLVKAEAINGANFGNGIVDDERFGMKRFIYYNNAAGPNGEPRTAVEYYNYLRGIWRYGAPMRFDGRDGTGNVGPITDFLFPGDSDPCNWGTWGEMPPLSNWTDLTAGNEPGDRRGLGSLGPFTFMANTSTQLDIALISGIEDGRALYPSVDIIKEFATQIKTEFTYMPEKFQNTEYGYVPVGIPSVFQQNTCFTVYPNPVSHNLHIELNELETANYVIYNVLGQTVQQGEINKTTDINVNNFSTGMYYLRIAGKTVKFVKE